MTSRAPKKVPKVPPAPETTDAELASLALFAEDAFYMNGGRIADPRLAPKWSVAGTLTAVDAPFRIGKYKIGARTRFYGWLLQSRKERVLVIRGTSGCSEWIIDGLFAPRIAHPFAGRVESGFWEVYASLRLDGKSLLSIATGSPITVVGHSLGAAMATYASLELARNGQKVRGVFIASPHPGNAEFSKAFGDAVPDHIMYRNSADWIPHVPAWFGYAHVPKIKVLSAEKSGITITGGPAGQHHLLSYIALIDPSALKTFVPMPCDNRFLACIQSR